MAEIAWTNYVPSKRDDVVMMVRRGEKNPEEAEAWAKENNQPPFASSPDITRFDPMRETDWTFAMAAAWIIWRTPDAVRKHWDAYLYECREWRCRESRFSDGRHEVGWEVQKCPMVSLRDVVRKAAKVDSDDSRLNAREGIDDFWRELKSGAIEATGIPFVRRDYSRSTPNRIVIPRIEWNDLSQFYFHEGEKDSIANVDDCEPRYNKVRVSSKPVITRWPERQDPRLVELLRAAANQSADGTLALSAAVKFAKEGGVYSSRAKIQQALERLEIKGKQGRKKAPSQGANHGASAHLDTRRKP
jgi:hypothetical protein